MFSVFRVFREFRCGCGEREREREKRGASAFTKKIGVGDLFPGKSETNDEEEEEEKEERTMETSFVVSAAFWAPVATESQNDMAFLVAINVETEMVSVARVLSVFDMGTRVKPV